MLKRILMTAWLCGALITAAALAGEPAPDVAQARALVQEFGTGLKSKLKTAMKEGGPLAAIEVCHLEAPLVAAAVGADTGWEVGRTSLKLRNPDNAPDAWETAVLKAFAERRAAGEDGKTLEFFEVVTQDGQSTLRYMKAIPLGGVCLKCHGRQVSAEVRQKIGEYYPEDAATGYGPGEIRGAFTLRKKI